MLTKSWLNGQKALTTIGADGGVDTASNATVEARERAESDRSPKSPLPSLGVDWCPGTDGYDGDGQGVRFRQAAAAPQGKPPYSAPQAKKILPKKGPQQGILPWKVQKQTL